MDLIEYQDTVALITRPRRFGKTLGMTMIREFFDITKDSKEIYESLAIMYIEYANRINSRSVIYFSFKNCTGRTKEELRICIIKELLSEYDQPILSSYEKGYRGELDDFFMNFFSSALKRKWVSRADIAYRNSTGSKNKHFITAK